MFKIKCLGLVCRVTVTMHIDAVLARISLQLSNETGGGTWSVFDAKIHCPKTVLVDGFSGARYFFHHFTSQQFFLLFYF